MHYNVVDDFVIIDETRQVDFEEDTIRTPVFHATVEHLAPVISYAMPIAVVPEEANRRVVREIEAATTLQFEIAASGADPATTAGGSVIESATRQVMRFLCSLTLVFVGEEDKRIGGRIDRQLRARWAREGKLQQTCRELSTRSTKVCLL